MTFLGHIFSAIMLPVLMVTGFFFGNHKSPQLPATPIVQVATTSPAATSAPVALVSGTQKQPAKTKTAEVSQPPSVTTKVNTSVQVTTPAPKDFRPDLVNLFTTKISFLKSKLALWDLLKNGRLAVIQDNKDSIAGSQGYQMANGSDADLYNLAEYGIKLWQSEVDEDTKIIAAESTRMNAWTDIKQKLETELSTLSAGSSPVTEAEYLLRKQELDTEVNQSDFDKMVADDSALGDYLNNRDKKVEAAITFNAQNFKDGLAIQAASLQAVAGTAPVAQPVITPTQTQPTSVHCETRQDVYGHMITSCTESSNMKTFTCDASTNVYGNQEKSCYWQ